MNGFCERYRLRQYDYYHIILISYDLTLGTRDLILYDIKYKIKITGKFIEQY